MKEQNTENWVKSRLLEAESLIVYVNSGTAGVLAPKAQLAKPSFSLALSHFFDRPLIFTDYGIKTDLIFDKEYFTCQIPWKSIWCSHPASEPRQVKFWNENSPGKGWDTALLQYLKLKPSDIVPATENKPDGSKSKKKPRLNLVKKESRKDPALKQLRKGNNPAKPALKLVKKAG